MSLLPTRLTLVLLAAGLLFPLVLPWVVPSLGWRKIALLMLAYDGTVLLAFLLDALILSRLQPLQARRDKPARLSLGARNEIEILLDNRSRWAITTRVRDHPPTEFQPNRIYLDALVPPHRRAIVGYELLATDRGNFSFGDIYLRCKGLFGLAWLDRVIPAAETVQVYPNLQDVRRYEALTRAQMLLGEGHRTRRFGSGREFSHFRDYTVDDDFRQVNWKASARRAKPISSVFESEHSQDVIFCLDTGRMMAAHVGSLTKLDHAINAILMLTHVSQTFQDNLGLLVFSHSVQQYLPPSRGRSQYARFLQSLYGVKPEPCYVNYREAFEYLIKRHTKRALVMVFTDLLDTTVSAEYREAVRVLGRFHLPLTLAVADVPLQDAAKSMPESVDQLYQTSVARELLHQRRELLQSLEHEGVLVLDTVPERLTVEVVNRYINLKMGIRW